MLPLMGSTEEQLLVGTTTKQVELTLRYQAKQLSVIQGSHVRTACLLPALKDITLLTLDSTKITSKGIHPTK